MIDLAQLDWRNPWWLLLALQPLVLMALAWRGRRRVRHYADAHLRPWAMRGGFGAAPWSGPGLLAAPAWVLLACAAAGPRLPLVAATPDGGAARLHEIDVIVMLDVSPSMQATDIAPQRLQRAKLEVTDLLQRLRGERIGLIAFSGTAGWMTPPTRDPAVVAHALALADPDLFNTSGSNLVAALDLARAAPPDVANRTRAVLLVTDGETDMFGGARGAAAEAAVHELNERGITVSVLISADPEGAALPGAGVSRPDVNALRALATHGGGRMEFARDGDADWRALYDAHLLKLPGAAPAPEQVQAWRELYPYALAPALLLFMLAHWPRRVTLVPAVASVALALSVAVLFPVPVSASESDAYAAYRAGDYALAQLLYREQRGYAARLGEGASAYRRARYAEAAEQFSAALLNATDDTQRADALYNLGNALFHTQRYAAAADAYGGVLALRPDDASARANQSRALARLRTLNVGERTLEGVPRRRGLALGETPLGTTDGGTPRDVDGRREPTPLSRGDAVADSERATTARTDAAARAAQYDPERDYRAAVKKLELVDDRPAEMMKELIRLDTPRDAAPPAGLPPW